MRTPMKLTALAVLAAFAGTVFAAPPTNESIDEYVKSVTSTTAGITKDTKPEERAEKMKAREKAVEEGIAKIDFTEASFEQVDKVLKSVGWQNKKVAAAVTPRIDALAKEKTAAGACAQAYRVMMVPPPAAGLNGRPSEEAMKNREKAVAEAYVELLKHPGLAAAIKTSDLNTSAVATGLRLSPATLTSSGILTAVEPVLEMDMTPEAASGLSTIIDVIAKATEGVDSGTRNRVLDKAAAMATKAAGKVDMTKPNAKGQADRLRDQAKKANGPFARGTLIGGQAPEVKFSWSSDGKLKTLADLKGKVVVVDFWATWCGPCVASFPKVRELVARYDGYDVAVVGVTSIQGFHIKRKDGEKTTERIDCAGDTAKELGFMPDFMKDMNMTWTVAFSEDSCFNPNFGVNGIPHVAIIDPAGKVRYNGLHPMDEGKHEKIDGLLKEFNLKVPAPEAKPEPAKEEKKDDAKK